MAQGDIVYSARIYFPPGDRRVSRFHIYTARADGSGRAPLTTGDSDNLEPKWSPNGTRVLFWQASASHALKLCLVGAGGGPAQVVTVFGREEYASNATWHPDGRRVLLVRNRYAGGALRSAVEVWDTRTRATLLTFPDASDYALSPSGQLLYLNTGTSGRLVRLDESGKPTPMPALDSPIWKDGVNLVGLAQGDVDKNEGYFGVRALLMADAGGTVTRKVTPRPAVPLKPDEGPVAALRLTRAMPNAPDTFLLYSEHRDIDFYALVSLTDGTVTRTRMGFKRPVWSPDGLWFVTYSSRDLASYGQDGRQVYVGPVYVGTDLTRPARKITPGLSWCGGVDWRPASPPATAG